MEVTMTRQILMTALPLAAALLASSPASALSDSEGRAIAACRSELLSRFDAGQVRSYRIGEIAGSSRSTRVTIYVNADRRYTFECGAGPDGRILTAALTPPVATRLAGGASGAAQGQ
jgi:hypothetical protein